MRKRIGLALILCNSLAIAADLRGVVKSKGLPIPGATVSAVLGEKKVLTATDEDGAYTLTNLEPGAWSVSVEMMGFAAVNKPAVVTAAGTTVDIELALGMPAPPAVVSQRRRPEGAAPGQPPPAAAEGAAPRRERPAGAPAGQQRAGGFQRLEVTQSQQSAELQAAMNAPQPDLLPSGDNSQSAGESFLVNGSLSRGLQAPGGMDDQFFAMQNRDQGPGGGFGGEQPPGGGPGGPGGGRGGPGGGGFGGPGGGRGGPGGGGFGGPGGGGFGGPGGGRGGPGGRPPGARPGQRPGQASFGNRNGRGREPFRGGASFSARDASMDAKPYSLNGQNIPKASYSQYRYSVNGGGILKIPKLITDDKTFFFINYSGSRASNPYDSTATLPSALERAGDFSQSITTQPVTIYDPATKLPFPNNRIPASRINPAAAGLLALVPLPNQPGNTRNYQYITSAPQNSENLGLRLNRSITKKDRLAGSFNFQHRSGENVQLYQFNDLSHGNGISSDVTWTRNIATGLVNNLKLTYSRNSNDLTPYFANGIDWARNLGIQGTSNNPVNYGPPNLSFTNFGGLSDGSNSVSHNQTISLSEGIVRAKRKQTLTMGFEFRRMQMNSVSDSNARGTYAFSGISTSGFDANGLTLANSGFDFADYLLGLPQSSSIRFGSSDIYFRGSSYNAYVSDDIRLRSNLTINIGLRYEYLTPLREKYGRMANLDIAPGFTGVAVATPNTPGPYTGAFPDGLVNPDRNNFAPRLGISWKPFKNKSTTIRTGYGMYYNGSVYNAAANRLAQQPPFAKTTNVSTSTAALLTLQTGFLATSGKTINNTYAIDRNYLVGYAQSWNFSVQQNLPWSLALELGYLGTKGTHLDLQRIPNSAPPGSPLTSEQRRLIGNAVGFTYDASDGNSIYHAGQVRLTRRFRQGISGNLLYTYSKSIDNASVVGGGGGGGGAIAQDYTNLAAERGVSSFDRTHNLNLGFQYSTAENGRTTAKRSVLLKDWTLTGNITVRSGSPFTVGVLGNRSDNGSGAVGTGRADVVLGQPLYLGGGFFNNAAFALPPADRYGNSSRNILRTPGFFAMNAGFGRNIRFGESRRGMDIRAEANNLFNSVTITRLGGTVNSSNYGLALDAATMRSVTLNVRLRF